MEIKENRVRKKRNLKPQPVLIDGSKIIIEALVRAGADVFIGYPITPSNLFYTYARKRFPSFYAAADEISVIQWMAGFSAVGKLPISATSFPGLALMVESINMAFMMELPMVLIVSQRLGPSTGSATTGAQGDLSLIDGIISGGYSLPVFCPSDFEDCWDLACKSLETAIKLRTPVVLLTSKEMVMTSRSFDLSKLKPITPFAREVVKPEGIYKSYHSNNGLIPPFIPLGYPNIQVRMNSSTHDNEGFIKMENPESIVNTLRLKKKIESGNEKLTVLELDKCGTANKLILSYGVSANACRDALRYLRNMGVNVDLLILKTLCPIGPDLFEVLDEYLEMVIVEENVSGQLKEMIYGKKSSPYVKGVNKIGSLITPNEIIEALS